MHHEIFGQTKDGEPVGLFTLRNAHGLVARVTAWGAGLVEMWVPDRYELLADVTLGFDGLEGYLSRHPHFGVTAGRFANRIAHGRFTLDGVEHTLATNDGPHHLHGGESGFGARLWQAERLPLVNGVRFAYTSPDGEEGYPGMLDVVVTYTLTEGDELRIDYAAVTDRPTVLNLTNHAYWNLAGEGSGDILEHELVLRARTFVPVDGGSIPLGHLASVLGGPMDFTHGKVIGQEIAALEGEPGGYDHNWVLPPAAPGELVRAAELYERKSGRVLTIETTEPGIQFYTGNYLDGSVIGKGGKAYAKHAGLCLETQHFPDAPNHPEFPSTVLRPGEVFRSATVHRFSVR